MDESQSTLLPQSRIAFCASFSIHYLMSTVIDFAVINQLIILHICAISVCYSVLKHYAVLGRNLNRKCNVPFELRQSEEDSMNQVKQGSRHE